LEELKEITAYLSERIRVSSTAQMREAQAFVRSFLRKQSIYFAEESFETEKGMPVEASIKVNGTEIEAYPFVNSLWGEREAEVVDEEAEEVAGKIVLVRSG